MIGLIVAFTVIKYAVVLFIFLADSQENIAKYKIIREKKTMKKLLIPFGWIPLIISALVKNYKELK